MADISAAERRAAAVAWAVSGAFGPVIPLFIMLVYRRSAFVARHAGQSVLAYGFMMAGAVAALALMLSVAAVHLAQDGAPDPYAPAPPLVQGSAVVVGVGVVLLYAVQIVASLWMARRALAGEDVRYPLVHRAVAFRR
jgi:uncharacterized membrane protein